MMWISILLLTLVIVFAIGLGAIEVQMQKMAGTLESIRELLAKEFRKEKDYYIEEERRAREFAEARDYEKEYAPMPPIPPAVVSVAENLKSITSSLFRLADATERAVNRDAPSATNGPK